MMPDISEQYKFVNLVLLFLISVAVITPFTLDMPNVNRYSCPIKLVPPTCFVKQYTGEECSMCGLTRSIVALYNGDLDLSLKFHPAGYIFICLLLFELLCRAVPIIFSHKLIPWLDIFQLVGVAFLFKIIVKSKGV
ncbi:DUF2752 domain-containing protein [Desulfobulbus rhabdoformis]|uniref:DUF2752 domain-containing protein n=1 Tax=Desulfobulbus rhabdoformis TaxID=34032 RepID=UPI0019627EF7|nr:DUF2752 domain-containing protein [Desulfobulbus rhabdoformis]MBM9615451.1 DUF2752 domain-containing protein [Desulfobulbus rhabdoformis]